MNALKILVMKRRFAKTLKETLSALVQRDLLGILFEVAVVSLVNALQTLIVPIQQCVKIQNAKVHVKHQMLVD